MKNKVLTLFLIFVFVMSAISQSQAFISVGFGTTFFNNLSVYGTWTNSPTYGQVWYPSAVGPGWAPYRTGHWVWTEDGWTWVSNEPFGWMTYHYGRWAYDPMLGWIWVPGAVWAPAWVTWYTGPTYIGWAPIGPFGIAVVQPSFVTFVPSRFFLSPNIARVVVPEAENVTIIRETTHLNNIRVVNNSVFNPGPSVRQIERATGSRVQRVAMVSRNLDPKQASKLGRNVDQLQGNKLSVFRPRIAPTAGHNTPLLSSESKKGIAQIGNKQMLNKSPLSQTRSATLHHPTAQSVKTVPSKSNQAVSQHPSSLRTSHGTSANPNVRQRHATTSTSQHPQLRHANSMTPRPSHTSHSASLQRNMTNQHLQQRPNFQRSQQSRMQPPGGPGAGRQGTPRVSQHNGGGGTSHNSGGHDKHNSDKHTQ